MTLLSNLKKIETCAIATIDTKTPVKLTGGKKNLHQGRIEKVTVGGNIMVFGNKKSNAYENMVKRRLAKEGKNPETFKLGKRAWGERVPESCLVVHKGKTYMETIYLKPPKQTLYLLDGKPIEKTEIQGLPKAKPGEQGGLSDKVQIRTYNLENITKFKCGELSIG